MIAAPSDDPRLSISCSASAAVDAAATRRPRSSNSVRMKKLRTISSSTIRTVAGGVIVIVIQFRRAITRTRQAPVK